MTPPRTSDIQIQACRLFAEAIDREADGEFLAAEALYTVAAELGYSLAMNNLAILIEDVITPARPAAAVYWLKRAVAAGYDEAAWNLAMRQRLAGRRRWYVHWLRIARDLGHAEAADVLPTAESPGGRWWVIDGVSPPPFIRGPRLVQP